MSIRSIACVTMALVLLLTAPGLVLAAALPFHEAEDGREFYELRVYQIEDFEKQQLAQNYLKDSLLPALSRHGINRVGVFTNLKDENDHSLFVLIPFSSIAQFGSLDSSLAADVEFQRGVTAFHDRPLKDPVFRRIESRLLNAFASMPKLELPNFGDETKSRIFELRLYESHTEGHAARKVEMFNQGETQLMRDVKLSPVFFGKTLIGPDVPNLVYMLAAPSEKAHEEHWKAFLKHPEWKRMKQIERYKDTVSKIRTWFLKPTAYSNI